MNPPGKPSVLVVYYTYTQQSLRVAEAMAGVLREGGCDVCLAKKFDRFPFRLGWLDHSRPRSPRVFPPIPPPGP